MLGLALLAGTAFAQTAPQYGIKPPPLAATPYVFDTAEQHGIKVSVITKAIARPFALEFLPDGDLLVAERGGNLRIIHQATRPEAVLDPQPIQGMPAPDPEPPSLGLLDISLHPDFARNHWLYFTFLVPAPGEKPAPGSTTQRMARLKLMRGKLENGRVSDVQTLFEGGRLLSGRLARPGGEGRQGLGDHRRSVRRSAAGLSSPLRQGAALQ